ncbi:hypothetical protein AeRB84_000693 [Aphanomyces euteiches]|nr:hypothetical protein AeRB84_000693 [Aphanomyces euteiches]
MISYFSSLILKDILQGREPDDVDAVEIDRSVADKQQTWVLKSLKALSSLSHLVSLNVSGHGIYTMDGLDVFVNLVHVKLARNNIKNIKIPPNCKWETLDLSGNFITQIPKAIQQLVLLQDLNLAGNGISVLKHVELLASLLNLQALNLSTNPLTALNSYKEFIVFTLPNLSILDSQSITDELRDKSRRRFTGPLTENEQWREAERIAQQEQVDLVEKQDILAAENLRLKSELEVKAQLLENKSKEWSSATHQLLKMQQELAMMHIDRRHPNHSNLDHNPSSQEGKDSDDSDSNENETEQFSRKKNDIGDETMLLVHKLSVLEKSRTSLKLERTNLEKEIVAIRNEIVLLDKDIQVLKQSLLGEQHAASSIDPNDTTYYYDDGRARLEELQTQIAFADVEASELEKRLVQKTREMLAADIRYPAHQMSDKRYTVFDKEISALSYKLERMTTQKAEWIDELHKLQAGTSLPVLRLKESPQSHCVSIPQSFRQCETPPPENGFFRLLISEKLEKLQEWQQRRLDLVDILMTKEASLQAVEDHLARIESEILELQKRPVGNLYNSESTTLDGDPDKYALSTPRMILDQLASQVLERVAHAIGNVESKAVVSSDDGKEEPTSDMFLTYKPKFRIVPGVELTSRNFALLSEKNQLIFDANTKLLLACKKLQEVENSCVIDATSNMEMDPKSKQLLSRLEVTLLSAVNLPRTRRFFSACDPYAVLYMEYQNVENGEWKTNDPIAQSRSTTKVKTLYPVWEEDFVFKPIDSMSARLCITLMDDKKDVDRHPTLGEVKIEVSSLWKQKRIVAWYPLTPAAPRDRPQPAVRLRLRFVYNKVDRLRRIVDRLVTEYIAEQGSLPDYVYECSNGSPVPMHKANIHQSTFEQFSPRNPSLSTPLKWDTEVDYKQNELTSVESPRDVSAMEVYREIFNARKCYRRVKGRRINGCFDRDSPYHPKQVEDTLSTSKLNVNCKIFKHTTQYPRDNTQAIPERYFGLTTDKSERLKKMFGKLDGGPRKYLKQSVGFQWSKPGRKLSM